MRLLNRTPGVKILAKDVTVSRWISDLIYFDGPLVSLYKGADGSDYLKVWVDCDYKKNRWYFLKVSRSCLKGYLAQAISLRDILNKAKEVIFFHTTTIGGRSQFYRTPVEKIPKEYLPDSDSYLYEEIATPESAVLVREESAVYDLGLDGDDLYLEDLSKIPKLYLQLYSFHYGLAHAALPSIRIVLSGLMDKWTGGHNAVNFFSGIQSVMPSIHRAKVKQLAYNSPGRIQIELLPKVAEEVEKTMAAVEYGVVFDDLQLLYKSVYSYFKDSGLKGFDSESRVVERPITKSEEERLGYFLKRFFIGFGWQDYSGDFMALDSSVLQKLRIVLAYYRRLRQLREFVVDGKLSIGHSSIL